ncbi:MAG: hypothetical protein IJP41_09635 [Synergistaceae bacterium]|nr:hypothetical protein [Synergistaceae bacterium]
MRISKGLENIHSVIDRHEAEWRKEQGEISEVDEALSLEESVRRRLTAPSNPEGRFSPDRFLGASQKSKNDNSDGDEKKVEIVSVIKSQDNNKQHSWLYNEVVKAINDAADDKNIKVVAVFVPVIQNSKEFEDLPVDRIVNLPPVSEDEISISAEELEQAQEPEQEQTQETNEDFNLLPETQIESDEELAEAFQTMEEKLDDSLQKENEENEEAVESESVEEVENVENVESVEPSEPIEQEEFAVIQEIQEPEEPEAVEEIEVEEVESEGQPEILQHEEIEITSESPEVLEEISNENETPDEEKKEDENIIVPPPLDDLDDDEVFDDSQFELSEDLDLQNENEEDKQPTLEDIGDFIN